MALANGEQRDGCHASYSRDSDLHVVEVVGQIWHGFTVLKFNE
jgi:hypothetical protein